MCQNDSRQPFFSFKLLTACVSYDVVAVGVAVALVFSLADRVVVTVGSGVLAVVLVAYSFGADVLTYAAVVVDVGVVGS
jgi:hypothetical protein